MADALSSISLEHLTLTGRCLSSFGSRKLAHSGFFYRITLELPQSAREYAVRWYAVM